MDAGVVTQWSSVLLACPGFDPQQHMHKVSRQQMADSRGTACPLCGLHPLPLTFTPGGTQKAGAPPPGLLMSPSKATPFPSGNLRDCRIPRPCSHLSLPTSAWSTPSNSPTAWYCTRCDPQVHVRVLHCELEQLMALIGGLTRKQLKPAILPKDLCPFSNQPAPLACLEERVQETPKRQVQSQVLGCRAHRFRWI